jgi:hypothetical protein
MNGSLGAVGEAATARLIVVVKDDGDKGAAVMCAG